MNTITRTPRPIGTTEINKQHSSQTITHIIDHYINTNYTYCGTPMNIETFSSYIGIDPIIITERIINISQVQYGNLDIDSQDEKFRALIFMALKNSLSDRSTALQHQHILLAEQGNKYIPFISSEVTKAIKLSMDANTNIMNTISKFIPQGTQVNIQNNLQQDQSQEQGLTVTAALDLIRSQANSTTLQNDAPAMEAIYLSYDIASMPEVNATLQTGYDDSKEGLNFANITKLQDAQEGQGHLDRRAEEIDIDLEADDL